MQILSMKNKITKIDDLETDVADHVLTIKFDREAKKNSITYDMYCTMIDLLHMAECDDNVRCVLFTGSGSIFSAGHDVNGFNRGLKLAYDRKPSYVFMQCLADFPKPVVAALNGDAIGIGATMLFHCDFVYSVPGCKLVFPFTEMGLIPEFASTVYLPQLLGHKKAMNLLLRKRGCSAEDAERWGVINEVVPPDEMAPHLDGVFADLVSVSPDAATKTKELLKAQSRDAVMKAIKQEAQAFHTLLSSTFVQKKLSAIKQKIFSR